MEEKNVDELLSRRLQHRLRLYLICSPEAKRNQQRLMI